jgi:hypothetical protein
MALPGFTSDTALYRSSRNYRGSSTNNVAVGRSGLEPAAFRQTVNAGGSEQPLSYVCTPDGSACACSGAADCMSCATSACKGMGCICSPTACGCS